MSGIEIAIMTAAAAATVAEGYNAYQQGKEQKKAYDANANILRQNAARKRMETSLNEDILRSQNRKQMAKARAAMSEAGMATSATTTGVLGQMGAEQEQNVLNQRYAGETEAVNYMNQANMQNYYGSQAKRQGLNAFKMSFIKAGVNAALAYATAGAGSTASTAEAGTSSAFVGGSKFTAQNASTTSRILSVL